MRGNSDPSGALLLCLGAGVWSFFKGFRVLREGKVIADTPRIPIRSIPMGFVHIRGKAEGEKMLSSPISHTPCCFYRVEIDQWKSSGDSHSWQHVCSDMDGYRFRVADETGKILVDAHSAEYDLPPVATREVHSEQTGNAATTSATGASDAELLQFVSYARMHSLTENIGERLDKHIAKASASTDDPQVQAKREALRELFAAVPQVAKGGAPPIDAFAKLASLGGPLKDPEREQQRQMMLERLHLMQTMQQSGGLPIPALKQESASGRFRLREYVVLPGQEYLIDGTCVENSETSATDRALITKGQNEPTFLISSKSDTQVRSEFRKRAFYMIFGGAAAAMFGLIGLLIHFHMF
jgi:hypothetical protein